MMALMLSCTAVLFAAVPAAAYSTGDWVNGRATFFGRDAWSLHEGSCGFGFVCPGRWSDQLASGYDLVAISDQSPLYNGPKGSQCGQCLEVSCRDAVVTDRYGERMDRSGTCKSESTSVKVKITDTCDCSYGANAESNARWCCGDQPHLDVSQWALDKLVKDSDKWGVFAIKYRTIGCNDELANPAPAIPLVKDPHYGDKPDGLNCHTQGGVSTESSTVSRAYVFRPNKPSAKHNKGGNHSHKFWARRSAYAKAKRQGKGAGFYKKLTAYFNQFNSKMKQVKKHGVKNPFGRRL